MGGGVGFWCAGGGLPNSCYIHSCSDHGNFHDSQGSGTCILLKVVLTSGKALGIMTSATQPSLLGKNFSQSQCSFRINSS